MAWVDIHLWLGVSVRLFSSICAVAVLPFTRSGSSSSSILSHPTQVPAPFLHTRTPRRCQTTTAASPLGACSWPRPSPAPCTTTTVPPSFPLTRERCRSTSESRCEFVGRGGGVWRSVWVAVQRVAGSVCPPLAVVYTLAQSGGCT